jgi:MFS family permease
MVIAWSAQAGFGVFLPVLSEELGWSRAALSLAASVSFLVGGVAGLGVGAAADRYGARVVMTSTVLMVAAAYLLASRMTALWHLYLLLGLLLGVGMASMYPVPSAAVSRWFHHQRGLALGILLSSIGVASMVGGPLAAFLLSRLDWQSAYLALGGMVLGLALPSALLIRSAPGTRQRGTLPLSASAQRSAPEPGLSLRQALSRRALWLVFSLWLLQGFAATMLAVHIVAYTMDLGAALPKASLALAVQGATMLVGRVAFGSGADRLGAGVAYGSSVGLSVAGLAGLLLHPPLWAIYAGSALFGFGVAGADTIVVRAVADIFGTRALGAVMAFVSLGWRIGAALGPAVAGYLYDTTGEYRLAFGTALLAMTLSGFLFVLARSRPPPA